MTQFEHKPGTGRVFRKEKTNPKQPDLDGEVKTPDGNVWRIALWSERDRNTNQFRGFFIKTQPKQQNRTQPPYPQQVGQYTPQQGQYTQQQGDWQQDPGPSGPDDCGMDDDIPF